MEVIVSVVDGHLSSSAVVSSPPSSSFLNVLAVEGLDEKDEEKKLDLSFFFLRPSLLGGRSMIS